MSEYWKRLFQKDIPEFIKGYINRYFQQTRARVFSALIAAGVFILVGVNATSWQEILITIFVESIPFKVETEPDSSEFIIDRVKIFATAVGSILIFLGGVGSYRLIARMRYFRVEPARENVFPYFGDEINHPDDPVFSMFFPFTILIGNVAAEVLSISLDRIVFEKYCATIQRSLTVDGNKYCFEIDGCRPKQPVSLEPDRKHEAILSIRGFPPKLGKDKSEYEDSIIEFCITYKYKDKAKIERFFAKYMQKGGKLTDIK